MKSRTVLHVLIALVIIALSGTLFFYSLRDQGTRQTFPATINDDCAPWDGSAFTVSIPIEGSVISISIYEVADIEYQITFSFPDESGQIGNASILREGNLPEQLSGAVSFANVKEDRQVKGRFDLVTKAGEHFAGKFIAEWGNEIVLCG